MALAEEALAYQLSLKREGRQRELGAYYTPDWMVETLLDHALKPVLSARCSPVHICDPACGAGAFLLGAAKRLRSLGRSGDRLTGIDIDPEALELTRRGFQEAGLPAPELRLANALESPPSHVDVMLGNPPFRNAIERAEPSSTLKLYPILGGTADLAFEFFAMASEAVSSNGRIGFVMPRAVLNAPAATALRGKLHPRLILTPEAADHFTGANVFVALVVTGTPGPCLTSHGERVAGDTNWWRLALGGNAQEDGERLGDHFEIGASLTTGDAYAIRDLIQEDSGGLRLITTGLIDPGTHQWGSRVCRFLGKDFFRPTLDPQRLTGTLLKRCERARRPKVVVAGLSKRLEAYLDAEGATLGSVSTYTIYHPKDDAGELERVLARLLSADATALFQSELGANAMGGGSITVTKAFLKTLTLAKLPERAD